MSAPAEPFGDELSSALASQMTAEKLTQTIMSLHHDGELTQAETRMLINATRRHAVAAERERITTFAERDLSDWIDRLIGWAKSGRTEEFYLMDASNVDSMRADIVSKVRDLVLGTLVTETGGVS